ncbi:acyltransferase [Archaeoglobus veneficus]|uniref:Galactoside O-acetyltransferase 3; maltose O-acetyltransferase 3 n=1 Tax=Archaeoglobus veneficus (strain DSM 11195 / SNP6) TaxID=693661 RepID=F2KMW1_ARCVS|nr:acyltransferase [Archaeoglobus veneficus]AEA46135.1 galactoside O-acetyltransferase 3; maltose O-acetyltransferase 3 [Archaeoglobus veneficus SNP6]
MARRTRVILKSRDKNTLRYWTSVKHPLRVALNYAVVATCRILPSLSLKCWLLRRIGVKVGENVSFGLESTVDIFFPELIEVGDNSIIGYNTVLLAHEFLVDELRVGEVKIGKNVTVGANCTVLPGVEIGDNSIIAAHSLVNSDIPPGVLAGGVPARVIREL